MDTTTVSGTVGEGSIPSGSTMASTKREFSAGGAVYKKDGAKFLWLVCQHSGYHKWVLPKGLIDEGEKAEATAVREVEEECGIKTKIIVKIPDPEKYIYTMNGVKIFKLVQYFLMEYVSGETSDHDWEMQEVEWLDESEVEKRLTFKSDKIAFKQALSLCSSTDRASASEAEDASSILAKGTP